MKPSFTLKTTAFILAIAIFFGSCSSTTLIQSVPPGAKLYVEGEAVGLTPYKHTDTKIVLSKTSLILEKEGYEPLSTTLVRDEEPDMGAIVGGFFIMPLWLWALKYKATHTYELKAAEKNK